MDKELTFNERVNCPCCYVRKTSNIRDMALECYEPGSNIGHYCDGRIHSECSKYIDRLKK